MSKKEKTIKLVIQAGGILEFLRIAKEITQAKQEYNFELIENRNYPDDRR